LIALVFLQTGINRPSALKMIVAKVEILKMVMLVLQYVNALNAPSVITIITNQLPIALITNHDPH
jgi:hypothetical protein